MAGIRGRRKPTTLKLLDGTHRPDRHGLPETEPAGEVIKHGSPAPEVLSNQRTIEIWETLLLESPEGVFTTADIDAMVEYCRTKFAAERAWDMVENSKNMQYVDSAGNPRRIPAIQILKDCREGMLKFWSKFGKTPSDRVGMNILPEKNTSMASRKRKSSG